MAEERRFNIVIQFQYVFTFIGGCYLRQAISFTAHDPLFVYFVQEAERTGERYDKYRSLATTSRGLMALLYRLLASFTLVEWTVLTGQAKAQSVNAVCRAFFRGVEVSVTRFSEGGPAAQHELALLLSQLEYSSDLHLKVQDASHPEDTAAAACRFTFPKEEMVDLTKVMILTPHRSLRAR